MDHFDFKTFVAESRKFLICLVAALGVLAVAMQDNTITNSEWLQVAIAFMTAGGVYFTPNQR